MLILALDPGKVWRDIRSSGPAPSLNDSRAARQSLAGPRDIRLDRRWLQVPAASRVRDPVEAAVEGGDVEHVQVAPPKAQFVGPPAGKRCSSRTAPSGANTAIRGPGPLRSQPQVATMLPSVSKHMPSIPRGSPKSCSTANSPREPSDVDGVGAELSHRARGVVALRQVESPLIRGE